MKFAAHALFGSIATLFAGATLLPNIAVAQAAPAGALFDLAVVHPQVLSGYELFQFSFVADSAATDVSFAFREVPAFFSFDDVSVNARGSNTNLIANAGFESATVGQTTPSGWGRFIQPIDVSAIGQVSSNSAPYGCPENLAHSGSQFWCDGSVEGFDGLYQSIATTAGTTYSVSFWLGDNSGQGITNPAIDMLGYAGDSLPVGTVPLPEPETYALMLAGLAVVGGLARRRKAQ